MKNLSYFEVVPLFWKFQEFSVNHNKHFRSNFTQNIVQKIQYPHCLLQCRPANVNKCSIRWAIRTQVQKLLSHNNSASDEHKIIYNLEREWSNPKRALLLTANGISSFCARKCMTKENFGLTNYFIWQQFLS